MNGEALQLEGYESATIAGHLIYMGDNGLIEVEEYRSLGSRVHELGSVIVMKILPEGYDLLDTVRADTVWNKTKSRLGDVGGTSSLEVVKQVAVSVAKGLLGLS